MIEPYIIIFIDLVGYSTNNEPIQVEFFKAFQRQIYHILYEEITDNNCVLIPTGDGIIIGLKNNEHNSFINSLRIVVDIFKWAKDAKYKFRLAIHVGDVNVIKDINRNNNLIGNLINDTSRILSGGDSDSIIISKDFYAKYFRRKDDQIGIANKINDKFSYRIIDEGTVLDKHSYIHNIYSIILITENQEYGSNKPLESNYYTKIYSEEYPKKENLYKYFKMKVKTCSDLFLYGIYNKNTPEILNFMEINNHRKVSIKIIYASNELHEYISNFFNDKELKLDTKQNSICAIKKWYFENEFKPNINLELFEYNKMPSFGASFVDYNIQGRGFIHISNYINNILSDQTPYFEIEWKTRIIPPIYKFYLNYLNREIMSSIKKINLSDY